MTLAPSLAAKHATALGVLCGAGSALFWAFGFVAARHGVLVGMSPLVSVAASLRLVGPRAASLHGAPAACAISAASAGGAAFVLTAFGGLPLALWSYFGYVLVPLGHGGVIQPSCAAVGGLVLARLVLKEALPPRRVAGALTIVLGLVRDRRRGAAHDGRARAHSAT